MKLKHNTKYKENVSNINKRTLYNDKENKSIRIK